MLLMLTIAPRPLALDRRTREGARRVERADGVDGEKARSLRGVRVDERANGEQRRVVDEDVGRAERSTAASTSRSQSAASATSAWTVRTGAPPSPSIAAAARARRSGVRPAMATRAPALAKARAIA